MSKPRVQSCKIENFKAIRDSKTVRLGPLTVLIGNNGSGKSSLIEGLATFQAIVERGLDEAMLTWRGFEHVWHGNLESRRPPRPAGDYSGAMKFSLRLKDSSQIIQARMQITMRDDEIFIQREEMITTQTRSGKIKRRDELIRDVEGRAIHHQFEDAAPIVKDKYVKNARPGRSIIDAEAFRQGWQFIALAPQTMGAPVPQKRTRGAIRLARDGSNIAEFLLDIRKIDRQAFAGILETL